MKVMNDFQTIDFGHSYSSCNTAKNRRAAIQATMALVFLADFIIPL
jgi:hypothetical protein